MLPASSSFARIIGPCQDHRPLPGSSSSAMIIILCQGHDPLLTKLLVSAFPAALPVITSLSAQLPTSKTHRAESGAQGRGGEARQGLPSRRDAERTRASTQGGQLTDVRYGPAPARARKRHACPSPLLKRASRPHPEWTQPEHGLLFPIQTQFPLP